MLTSKQRSYLKGVASKLDPAFQVGKGGVSPEQAEGIEKYLKAHELVKINVLDNSLCSAAEAAQELAEMTGSEVVVLFKRNPEKPSVSLNL